MIVVVLFVLLYSLLALLMIIGFKSSMRQSKTIVENRSSVSIIIAARNEANNIVDCLNALSNLNYDKQCFEVIVVNDHSTDNTWDLINQFEMHNLKSFNLKENSGKKAALAFGIERASFDHILICDADTIVPPNWLKTMNLIGKDYLIGPVKLFAENNFIGHFQVLDFLSMQAFTFSSAYFGFPTISNGANMGFRKVIFDEVNGFDNHKTPSGDDVFLLEKVKQHKRTITGVLNENAMVTSKVENGFAAFLKQRLRWASKSKYYKSAPTILMGILSLIMAFVQLFIYAQLLLVGRYFDIYIILLATKWLIDFILLILVADFYNQKGSLWYYLPIQLIHPFYIVGVGVASFFLKYEWKGRKF